MTLGLLLVLAGAAAACFGPKLYLGIGDGPRNQVLTSLVAIYVQEKTGIEVVRQPLAESTPLEAIHAEKVDFAFAEAAGNLPVLLTVSGQHLLGGPRIGDDLQFTTVRPALERLGKLLQAEQVALLQRQVAEGAVPMEAARSFLLDRGWI